MNDTRTFEVSKKSILRICLFSFLFFSIFNLVFAVVNPELGYYSLYDHLFVGRKRFPFGENPALAYNFSLFNVYAMFESHEIESISRGEEYSVFILGDSSVWGTLLRPEQTLSGQLNNMDLIRLENGQPVRFYNLGYPTISVTKDLMLLEEALSAYSPDMVIWMVTLEALPWERQLSSPLVQNNANRIADIAWQYNLPLLLESEEFITENFWDRTILGRRRELADLVRLQLYGVLWEATGIDQYYPESYTPAQRDLASDEAYYDFQKGDINNDNLAFEVIQTGANMWGTEPEFMVINEPIMVSSGENHHIRYNFYYPCWAYDEYRESIADVALEHNWRYHDLWNIIPETEFTNSAIHLTPLGESILAEHLKDILIASEGFSQNE